MIHPLGVDGSVQLAVIERSGLIESRHLGAAVVVAPDGSVLEALGDIEALVYPRSSLKFFQALTVLRCGVDLDGEELVLATASHAGTPEHLRVVWQLLSKAGLTEDSLQCPLDWPYDPDAAAVARTQGARRRIQMNCSGKHAAFLIACKASGWDTGDYLDPLHPLQRSIQETIQEFTGQPVGHVGTDGCGAPLFAVSLLDLATGASRFRQSNDPLAQRMVSAIMKNAWAIDGPGRANTVVIEELGILAKGGAEGVIVMAANDGTSVALKMLDGSARATTLVALDLLARVCAVDAAEARRVADLVTDPILGGGLPVGTFRSAF